MKPILYFCDGLTISRMLKFASRPLLFLFLLTPLLSRGEDRSDFQRVAPQYGVQRQLRLKTNIVPWVAAIPNLGAEFTLAQKWSACLDVWYCPWKISDKYSFKTAALLPEGRFWFSDNHKGSFLNIHANIAWYNVRFNRYRYQDRGTPLFGGGIGYGYRVDINGAWGFEFEIGAGVAHGKYDRYYNIENGALKNTQKFTYWGIDRFSLSFTYNLCDI